MRQSRGQSRARQPRASAELALDTGVSFRHSALVSDGVADEPRPLAVLRLNGSALLNRFPLPLSYGIFILFVSLSGLGTPAGRWMAIVGVLWLAASVGLWRRSRIECFEDRIVLHSARGTTVLRWEEVISVSMGWRRSGRSTPAGYALTVWPRPPGRPLGCSSGLRTSAFGEMERVLGAHAPEVALNPEKPWRDRFGTWHADHLDEDPSEAIRTVRRAFVGP
jgi:hypothetical protein